VDKLFNSKILNDEQKRNVDKVSEAFICVAHVVSELPDSREKSLAITNLQQAKMWSVEAIAKN